MTDIESKPTREKIISVWEKAKSLAHNQDALLDHMINNSNVLVMWIVDELSDGVDTHVKLAWNIDDEFREDFGRAQPDGLGDNPDYGSLLSEYASFKVDIDTSALPSLVSGNTIAFEHG
jgi:hypothetical protein